MILEDVRESCRILCRCLGSYRILEDFKSDFVSDPVGFHRILSRNLY